LLRYPAAGDSARGPRAIRAVAADQGVPVTRRPYLLAVALVALAASGCASSHRDALQSSLSGLAAKAPTETSSSTSSATAPRCAHPTASLRPRGALAAPGQMPAGTYMRRIQQRGRLIVGVDQNTLLVGYLNPFDGRIEGFDVDVARQVAQAIFGDPNRI